MLEAVTRLMRMFVVLLAYLILVMANVLVRGLLVIVLFLMFNVTKGKYMKSIENQTKSVVNLLLFIGTLFILAGLFGCGNGQTSVCTMTWSCGNQGCANAEGSWSGNGSFSGSNDESDCLVWETAFLNSNGYPNNRVSSCSCN